MKDETRFEPVELSAGEGVAGKLDEGLFDDKPALVVLFDPRVDGFLDQLVRVMPDALGLSVLPICVGSRPDDPRRVDSLPGVIATKSYPSGLDLTGGLLQGLNVLALIGFGAAFDPPQGPLLVGGTDGSHGTVVLGSRYPPMLDFDPSRKWPTPPALMPVVNVSIGPESARAPTERNDPVNFATAATRLQQLTVVAAGNSYRRAHMETMSPFAEMPWVLAVGATEDDAGTKLADYSSAGIEGDPESGPDVVAHGVSRLDPEKDGTSFAAPRVTGYAMTAAAALLQLRHAAQELSGDEPRTGIPLVGYGMVDSFGDDRYPGRPRLTMPAMPAVAVDLDALGAGLKRAKELGVALDIAVRPERLRRMLLAAARPMPGYGPHQVGAGFLGDDVWRAWVEALSPAHLLRLCADAPVPTQSLQGLDDGARLFPPGEVELLVAVQQDTMPVWRWDWKERRMSMRPEAAIEENWDGAV